MIKSGLTLGVSIILVGLRAVAMSFVYAGEANGGSLNVTGDEPVGNRAISNTQTGFAVYYHPGLQGRRTASGERFDHNAMTAAQELGFIKQGMTEVKVEVLSRSVVQWRSLAANSWR